jgi:hypothetical protein
VSGVLGGLGGHRSIRRDPAGERLTLTHPEGIRMCLQSGPIHVVAGRVRPVEHEPCPAAPDGGDVLDRPADRQLADRRPPPGLLVVEVGGRRASATN